MIEIFEIKYIACPKFVWIGIFIMRFCASRNLYNTCIWYGQI